MYVSMRGQSSRFNNVLVRLARRFCLNLSGLMDGTACCKFAYPELKESQAIELKAQYIIRTRYNERRPLYLRLFCYACLFFLLIDTITSQDQFP